MKIKRNKQDELQKSALEKAMTAPVIDLVIRYDARTSSVTVFPFGGRLDIEAAYKILDMAREAFRREELKAMAKKLPDPETHIKEVKNPTETP